MRQKLHTGAEVCYIIHLLERRNEMREQVEAAINKVRPALQADGGDVELVDVEDGVVKVRLTGACNGCPMATMTLRDGIQRVIMEEVPGVKQIISV
jgi:Fe-S cluster biogenesis protein NfuA